MRKVSKSARGRNAGVVSSSARWSYCASAFSADGCSVRPKTSCSSVSNQYRTGVPAKSSQCSRQPAPDLSTVGDGPVAGAVRPSQFVEADAVGVEQPQHVVVGRDEQRRGVGERLVVRDQAASTCPWGR